MTSNPPPVNPVERAKAMYFAGWRVTDIAHELKTVRSTVQSWKDRNQWDQTPLIERVTSNIVYRLNQLVIKDQKTGTDFKEIDLLHRQLSRQQQEKTRDAKKNSSNKKPKKNYIDPIAVEKLQKAFTDELYGHQKIWYDNRHQRRRGLLKSRQIGATYYFGREAFVDLVLRGHNKIFLSASRAQAREFRKYIIEFVRDTCGIELTGDPMTITTEDHTATLYFLGTNAETAQSYHGDLYMDEIFWIPRFQKLKKVASAMAAHKKWTSTFFSTSSTKAHEAYGFWSGDEINQGRAKKDKVKIDLSHANLKDGKLCDDGMWRHIVTVEDACALGCDLFDIEQLKLENSPTDYNQLYMCEFIDDKLSAFNFNDLMRAMVDSYEAWADYKAYTKRPYGNNPVAIGIDPAKSIHGCAVAVIALSTKKTAKHRLLEKLQLNTGTTTDQAAEIQKLTQKYNVVHMEIDETGMGLALSSHVELFYKKLVKTNYNISVKNELVIKALDVFKEGRFEMDASDKDVVQAFLAIQKTLTKSGTAMTYTSTQTDSIGHSDIAWAIMHALHAEGIGATTGKKTARVSYG